MTYMITHKYLLAFFITFSMGIIAMDAAKQVTQDVFMASLLRAREKSKVRSTRKNKKKADQGPSASFTCGECHKTFNGVDVLKQHMLTHSDKISSRDVQSIEKKRQRDEDVSNLNVLEAVSLEKKQKTSDSDVQGQEHLFASEASDLNSNIYQPNITLVNNNFYYYPRIVRNIIVHKPA